MASQKDPELKSLMDKFVCVRIVQMGGVDLRVYQFDPLLSWAVMFMYGDTTIYGRYGSASPQAKRSKKDSNPNHTLAGLKAALRAALALHEAHLRNPAFEAVLQKKSGFALPWRYVEETPVAKLHRRLKRVEGEDTKGCVHCHEIPQALIDSSFMSWRKVTDRMLWMHPDPAILGLSLSRDHCARVTAVAEGSLAAQAGIQVGDDLELLDGQPLCSVADVQWVLHRFPDAGGPLTAFVRRGESHRSVKMELEPGWRRKGDWAWRYRVAGYAMWLWGGVTLEDTDEGVRVSHLAPWWFKRENKAAKQKLKVGDVIVEVDGRTGWTRSTYLAYLMREKMPGSPVELVVMRRGTKTKVAFPVPSPRPKIMGH